MTTSEFVLNQGLDKVATATATLATASALVVDSRNHMATVRKMVISHHQSAATAVVSITFNGEDATATNGFTLQGETIEIEDISFAGEINAISATTGQVVSVILFGS